MDTVRLKLQLSASRSGRIMTKHLRHHWLRASRANYKHLSRWSNGWAAWWTKSTRSFNVQTYKYAAFARQHLRIRADEVKYFRRITRHDKHNVKIIVRIDAYEDDVNAAEQPKEHQSCYHLHHGSQLFQDQQIHIFGWCSTKE